MVKNGPGAEAFGVSRETYARLETFAAHLNKWTARINLISRGDQNVLWSRHIADSLQIYRMAPKAEHWVDLGSGGGFPAIVAAILAAETSPNTKFTLIESDKRKAVFLRTAARECAINAHILADRIELATPQMADIVSARALADLDRLLELSQRHVATSGTMLFPKGKSWGKEVDNARVRWHFDYEAVKSDTDSEGVLLVIKGVSRV